MEALSIVSAVGCRLNSVRMSSLLAEMRSRADIRAALVHTGSPSDFSTDVFLQDLELPSPDIFLNVGSGSDARQTALIMQSFEGVIFDLKPDILLVMGGGNSTLACAMTAVKLGIPTGHVDAGLRSFDREMPEEINRLVTDAISDFLFVSERTAVKNLQRESIPIHRIFHVGSVVVDTLLHHAERIARSTVLDRLSLVPRTYILLALLQRNVGLLEKLEHISAGLARLSSRFKIVAPVSPGAVATPETARIWQQLESIPNLNVIDPPSYIDRTKLLHESVLAVTDSGSIQEEATALGIPCLTISHSTEREATVTHGANRLVGTDPDALAHAGLALISSSIVRPQMPDKWDGLASKRIIDTLQKKREEIKQLHKAVRMRSICPNVSSAA